MRQIDEKLFATMMPGILKSAHTLLEKSDELNTEDKLGVMTSTIVSTAHCAELLLKYKIQQEQGCYRTTHKLYCLFKELSDDSKTEIEEDFNELSASLELPNGWEDASSVFRQADDVYKFWRYVVEAPKIKITTFHRCLYIATVSVYMTIPILPINEEVMEMTALSWT